jgi:hypothetical protein
MEKITKFEASKELNGFTKTMKEMLFNSKIMNTITDTLSGEVWAKVTEIYIDGEFYYGIWERNIIFNEGWRLLHFGTQPVVQPQWKKYTNDLIKHGIIWKAA